MIDLECAQDRFRLMIEVRVVVVALGLNCCWHQLSLNWEYLLAWILLMMAFILRCCWAFCIYRYLLQIARCHSMDLIIFCSLSCESILLTLPQRLIFLESDIRGRLSLITHFEVYLKFSREKTPSTLVAFYHIISIRAKELPLIDNIKFIYWLRLSQSLLMISRWIPARIQIIRAWRRHLVGWILKLELSCLVLILIPARRLLEVILQVADQCVIQHIILSNSN